MEEGWEGTDNLIIVLMYKICSKNHFTHHVVYPHLTAVWNAVYASSLLLMPMTMLFHC